jgi:Spy/CpxP family protein refolding chaperone
MNRVRMTVRFATLALCAAVLLPALAPAQDAGTTTTFDRLGRLKRALSEAGAAALTAAQEDRINTLITNFRNSQTPPTPSATLETARREYDNAILNGDSAGAAAQAAIITTETSANSTARLKSMASFGIAVIKELRSNGDQAGALVKSIGATGTVRLVLSLAGPGGFGGRGPGGFGGGPAGAGQGFRQRARPSN